MLFESSCIWVCGCGYGLCDSGVQIASANVKKRLQMNDDLCCPHSILLECAMQLQMLARSVHPSFRGFLGSPVVGYQLRHAALTPTCILSFAFLVMSSLTWPMMSWNILRRERPETLCDFLQLSCSSSPSPVSPCRSISLKLTTLRQVGEHIIRTTRIYNLFQSQCLLISHEVFHCSHLHLPESSHYHSNTCSSQAQHSYTHHWPFPLQTIYPSP